MEAHYAMAEPFGAGYERTKHVCPIGHGLTIMWSDQSDKRVKK